MRLVLLCLFTTLSFAQIRDLATTQDGSRVYFASTIKLRQSDESLASKIFMIDSTGAYLLDDEGTVELGNSYSNLHKPGVTADGSMVVETATRFCNFGTVCGTDEFSRPRTPPGMPDPFLPTDVGGVAISRNGRYAGLYSTVLDPAGAARITLIDFSTGMRTVLTPSATSPVQVSSTGVVLATVYSVSTYQLSLINAQSEITPFNPQPTGAGSMSDDAQTIVYIHNGLYISDATGQGQPLGPQNANDNSPWVSSDGSSVAFLSGPTNLEQLFFIRTDGSGRRPLTSTPDGITTATISGDGKIAYAITGSGALLKIDTQTGTIQQIVSAVPQVTVSGGGSPGSLVILSGSTQASATVVGAAPYTTTLGGVTATVDGLASPLLSVSPTEVIFQIPWDSPIDPTPPPSAIPYVSPLSSSVVLPGGNPYFDVAFALPLFEISPQLFALGSTVGDYLPIAAHQNGELVTLSNPAVRGEVVTLYGTGFGPVTPSLATGVPAPLNAYSVVTTPFQFFLAAGGARLLSLVPFLGLAPGTLGIYQMNLEIPSNLPTSGTGFLLGSTTPDSAGVTFIGAIAVN